MAREILDDGLWQLIKPLIPLPKRRRRKFPGRKPLDVRRVLTGVIFVLRNGIAWEDLPQEMGCGSGTTCWRLLRRWQRAGVWQKIHERLLTQLNSRFVGSAQVRSCSSHFSNG